MYEILLGLDLEAFGLDNWQSTIRHYVKVHPKYGSIANWYGQETADLTYNDINGDLTRILIRGGHLDQDVWQTAKPKYFFEVKATPKDLSDTLFVSESQNQRVSGGNWLDEILAYRSCRCVA